MQTRTEAWGRDVFAKELATDLANMSNNKQIDNGAAVAVDDENNPGQCHGGCAGCQIPMDELPCADNMVRPVRCSLCHQPMFYQGDARAVPELEVELKLPSFQDPISVKGFDSIVGSLFGVQKLYIHVECWNTWVGDRNLCPPAK